MRKSTISMAIFNSCVKLPEGIWICDEKHWRIYWVVRSVHSCFFEIRIFVFFDSDVSELALWLSFTDPEWLFWWLTFLEEGQTENSAATIHTSPAPQFSCRRWERSFWKKMPRDQASTITPVTILEGFPCHPIKRNMLKTIEPRFGC